MSPVSCLAVLYFAKRKKMIIFLKRKAEVNYLAVKIFRSIFRISLPAFPFEFSVERLQIE